MEDRKLVDFAHWLNDHPGEWNLWPYLILIQADRRDTVASMRLVMDRIKIIGMTSSAWTPPCSNTNCSTVSWASTNGGVHENGLALKMRLKA